MRVKEEEKYRIRRACGAMETRQTTNLKIAGSTPARLVFLIKVNRYLSKKEGGTTARQYHRRIGYGVRSGIDGMYVWMDGKVCIDSLSVWV